MAITSDLQIQQLFESATQTILNNDQQQKVRDTLTRIQEAMASYRQEVGKINSDADLTGEGKARRLGDLGQRTGEQLEHIVGGELKELDKRVSELEYSTRPQDPASDPVLDFLQQQEIRNILREKDEIEVMGLYQELAVNGRDDLTMRAIENAPTASPLISDASILQAGKRARGERHSPDATATLSQLRQWRSMLQSAVDSARADLGLPPDDIISRLAAGDAA